MDKMRQIIKPSFAGSIGHAALGILYEPNCLVDADETGKCFSAHPQIVFKHAVEVPCTVMNDGRKLFIGDATIVLEYHTHCHLERIGTGSVQMFK